MGLSPRGTPLASKMPSGPSVWAGKCPFALSPRGTRVLTSRLAESTWYTGAHPLDRASFRQAFYCSRFLTPWRGSREAVATGTASRAWRNGQGTATEEGLGPISVDQSRQSKSTEPRSTGEDGTDEKDAAKGEMSRARRRRVERSQKQREERKQEQERIFQEFASEVASRHPELVDLLDEDVTPDNAAEVAKKVEERLKAKFGDWMEERTGSHELMSVAVESFDPFNLTLWIQLQTKPSEDQLHSLSSVFRAWYLMGKLGAYNAANLQFHDDMQGKLLAGQGQKYKWGQDEEDMLPAAMHNIGDLEIQGSIVRVWVDMGTADMLALDVLVNALLCFSSDHVGIKSIVIGGDRFPGWKDIASEKYEIVEI